MITLAILLQLSTCINALNVRLNLFKRHHFVGQTTPKRFGNLNHSYKQKRNSKIAQNIQLFTHTSACSVKTCQKCEHFVAAGAVLAGNAKIFCPTVLALPGCCPRNLLKKRF